MRIENITRARLEDASERELYSLRLRFIQLWNRNFKDNDKAIVGTLNREEFLNKYGILVEEMKKREYTISTKDIDRALFVKDMQQRKFGFDVTKLQDLTLIPDFISIAGSFVKSPGKANDFDLVIRQPSNQRDEGLELLLKRSVKGGTELPLHFIYSPYGPHGSYIPMYDLVLRRKDKTTVNMVKSASYYTNLDSWNDIFVADFVALVKELKSCETVLDLGCGSGRVLEALGELGYDATGIDDNSIAVEMCEDKKLRVKKLDLEKDPIPFNDNSFDAVIGVHFIEHVEDISKVFEEAYRVAKRKVIFVVPLGERKDVTHKHTFVTTGDCVEYLKGDIYSQSINNGDNTAIIVVKKDLYKGGEVRKDETKLRPFDSYVPPKPTMANLTEAFKYKDIESWIKDKWPVVAEEKLNGFRCIAEKLGSKVRIWSEGKQDRTKVLPLMVDVLTKIPDDFILDMSLGIERKGEPLPRIKLMTLMADELQLEKEDVVVGTCFDLPYWKEDIHSKPLSDRRKQLEDFYSKYLKPCSSFALTHYELANNESELTKLFSKLSKLPQSEGIMIKSLKSIWNPKGTITDWAKIKLEVEIKVIALDRVTNRAGNYNYHCGLLLGDAKFVNLVEYQGVKYIDLGKTFNTELKANPGDILTIGVEEIILNEKDNMLQWLGPRVLDIDKDRKTPYAANQVIDLAGRGNVLQKTDETDIIKVEGNIDYKLDDVGRGVLQIHIMGIKEEEVEELKKVSSEAAANRHNIKKLKMLLKGAIGEHGAHLDMRLVRKGDKYFEGGEIMLGNLSGLDKLDKLEEGGKLRWGFKTPHAEEMEAETIRGPVSWMEAGKRSIEIFEPGSAGAFSKTYGAMIILDTFSWKLIQADRHAKKLDISDSKLLKPGIYLIAYVPVMGGTRVWMISKLKEIERSMTIIPVTKSQPEHIVYGIVYEPDETDSQGDVANEAEIREACYYFMEHTQVFKVNHKGNPIDVTILENYIAPDDLVVEGRPIKKGSWVLSIRVNDEGAWNKIVLGELQGYSMAGHALAQELE